MKKRSTVLSAIIRCSPSAHILSIDVVRNHQFALINREGKWQLIKSFEGTRQLIKANKELSDEIAERVKVEAEIRARNALLRLAARKDNLKEYLDAALKLIKNWSDCQAAGIRLLNEEGKIPYASHIGFSKEFWERENWLSIKH